MKRMKEKQSELSQLKRLYADMALENQAVKGQIEMGFSADRTMRDGTISGGRSMNYLLAAAVPVWACPYPPTTDPRWTGWSRMPSSSMCLTGW